jgi:putative transcriptional regulator
MGQYTEENSNANISCLTGQLLISMPSLNDSFFSHTITLICDHNCDGAMGIVLNQSLDTPLNEIFTQLEIESSPTANTDRPIMCGGPVQPDRGFVLHSAGKTWDSTISVSDELSLTVSQDIIRDIAAGPTSYQFMVALGYAGWDEGQLESEMANNAWLTLPSDADLIFNTSLKELWTTAAKRLGVNLDLISSTPGHA